MEATPTATALVPAAGVDELARRRSLDRERARRYRERSRAPSAALSPPAGAAPRSPFLPTHETKRLDAIGSTPEAEPYLRTPPALDASATPPSPEVEASRRAGAAKVAMVVATLFRFALQDATNRYAIGDRLAEVGLPPDQVGAALSGAVGYVYSATERACLKHGVGLTLPYEDELVALGAASSSVLYLAAKFTGRLDAQPAAAPARGSVSSEIPPLDKRADDQDPYAPLRFD